MKRVFCYFRNLVHTVYREARHVGPPGDSEAKLEVATGRYTEAARKCRAARQRLKGTELFKMMATASTRDILKQYVAVTGLEVPDLVVLFRQPGWKANYGGPRWAVIAETLLRLQTALDAGNLDAALSVCDEVDQLHHNTDKLVPSRAAWQSINWLQEKWPQLCD
jgi:hypothetical protein